MAAHKLEARVAALEVEVAQLKQKLEEVAPSAQPWWEQIAGAFANDSVYEAAMRLGREYRQSQRPKPAQRRKR